MVIGGRGVAVAVVVLAAVMGCGRKEDQGSSARAVEEVVVAVAERRDVSVTKEFIGQTVGSVDAEIRARVDGVVVGIHFEEGKEVKEGQLLYTIDSAPYDAKVAEAQGQLAEAETKLAKAQVDLKRVRPLAQMKALSERDLDAAIAQEGTARGAVAAAKAALETTTIQRGYTKITSPTTGTIGISAARIGEYVGVPPHPTVLNTVSKLDPIHVRLSLSEQEYLYFARQRQEKLKAGEAPPERPLELFLADGMRYEEIG